VGNGLSRTSHTRGPAVTLASGKVYRDARVPLQAFNNCRDAESAGKHCNTYFKPFLNQAA
jgi:hypothetical protein